MKKCEIVITVWDSGVYEVGLCRPTRGDEINSCTFEWEEEFEDSKAALKKAVDAFNAEK